MDTPQPGNLSLSPLADQGRCKECGYALRALTLPRCPECGRPFDPADPETMDLPEHLRPRNGGPPEPFGNNMVGAAVLINVLAAAWFFIQEPVCQFLLVAVWTPVGIRWYRRNHASPEQLLLRPEGYRHWRRVLKATLLLSILSFPLYHSCCHATTIRIGPVGISHSTCGGPCNTQPHHGGRHIAGNWYWAW